LDSLAAPTRSSSVLQSVGVSLSQSDAQRRAQRGRSCRLLPACAASSGPLRAPRNTLPPYGTL